MPGMARRLVLRLRDLSFRRYMTRRGVVFEGRPTLLGLKPTIENDGQIMIGSNCCLRAFRLPVRLAVREGAELVLGAGSYVNDGVNICATKSIQIGKNARIGDMTYIYDTSFHELTPGSGQGQAPVSIGDNVWIGANCMILAGSTIGNHSVIGAGSVVTGPIPKMSLAVGVPARVVREFTVAADWVRK